MSHAVRPRRQGGSAPAHAGRLPGLSRRSAATDRASCRPRTTCRPSTRRKVTGNGSDDRDHRRLRLARRWGVTSRPSTRPTTCPSRPSLKVIAPVGKVPGLQSNTSRSVAAGPPRRPSTSRYAHAMAPGAKILVVALPGDRYAEPRAADPWSSRDCEYVVNHRLGTVDQPELRVSPRRLPEQGLARCPGAAPSSPRPAAQHHRASPRAVTGGAVAGRCPQRQATPSPAPCRGRPATRWSRPSVARQLHLDAERWRGSRPTTPGTTPDKAVGAGRSALLLARQVPVGHRWRQVQGLRPSLVPEGGHARGARAPAGVPDISMTAACDGGCR